MNTSPRRTFFTSPLDCIVWMGRLLFGLMAITAVAGWLASRVRGTPVAVTMSLGLKLLAFVTAASLIGGLLLFFFGWLGRVTLSSEGIQGPRYSGLKQFVPWSEVKHVEAGHLNGWPCAVVHSHGNRPPTYLMVNGRARANLVECIRELAPAANPLRDFYCGNGR